MDRLTTAQVAKFHSAMLSSLVSLYMSGMPRTWDQIQSKAGANA